jgi:hypothetical protein
VLLFVESVPPLNARFGMAGSAAACFPGVQRAFPSVLRRIAMAQAAMAYVEVFVSARAGISIAQDG